MIAWMLWSILMAALISLAGLGAERALGLYGRPRRWVWATAMVASMAVPIALAFAPAPPRDLHPLVTPNSATPLTTPADPLPEANASAGLAERVESRLPIAWALGTATLLALLGVSAARLARARRRWSVAEMSGIEVFETDDLGPAVIGLLNPRIAIPRWVRRLDSRLQELVIRHEVEHQRAGDPRLLVAGLVARALFPWCLPVWWQFRRLRLAIEIDCDRRVLACGPSLADYGELLLEVGRRSSGRPAHAVGIFERRSHLERRVRSLRPGRPAHRVALTVALTVASVGAVATGLSLPLPDPPIRLARISDPRPPTESVGLTVTVGAEHGDLRTIEELERLDPHRRDLGGYLIHGKEALHETSHGCGMTYDGDAGVLEFHVDPGDRDRPLAGYCYLLIASSYEGVEVRSRVARFDTESGFRTASYDSPPECENCSPASAMAAIERAGVVACRFRVQPYLETDGTVRTMDVLASDDRCVPVLHRWAEGIRWTAGRQRGEPVEGWASPISGGREGSVDVVPAGVGPPPATTTTPVPVDTPPRFDRTPFDERPVCVENCGQSAILAALVDGGVESATCDAVIGIRIGVEGAVTATDVLKSDDVCEAALTDWAESTRWTPARRDGDPVPVWIAQPIRLYPEPESAETTRQTSAVHVEAETDPDAIAKTTLRRAMTAQEMYRAENDQYADGFELDLSPPQTVTLEVRSDGDGYVMVVRHDHGTAAFCASSATGAISEGTDC